MSPVADGFVELLQVLDERIDSAKGVFEHCHGFEGAFFGMAVDVGQLSKKTLPFQSRSTPLHFQNLCMPAFRCERQRTAARSKRAGITPPVASKRIPA